MTDDGMTNPFDAASDPDRHFIWQRIVAADCEAFVTTDWPMIEPDFDAEHFEGIRCFASMNPDDWHLVYDTVNGYRDAWLEYSKNFRAKRFRRPHLPSGNLSPHTPARHRDRRLARPVPQKIHRRPIARKRFYAHRQHADAVPSSQA
jgi:hypothetical protein